MPQLKPERAFGRRMVGGWVWLILAPLLLLAALGVRGIQRSREAVLENARVAAGAAAERGAQRFQEMLKSRMEEADRVRLYPRVPVPLRAEAGEAEALYARALSAPRAEAEQTLERLWAEHPDAMTAAGLPLRALVAWARLQRCEDAAACGVKAGQLGRVAVEVSPSLLSGALLERAAALLDERGGDSRELAAWRQRWAEEEAARDALRAVAERDKERDRQWVENAARRWWVEREADDRWRVLPNEELARMASEARNEIAALLPRGARLSLEWDGREVTAPAEGERLASREAGLVSAAAILADRAELFREQREQGAWLAGLLGVALLAVLAGLLAMQRALVSEQQLSRQKSDFVASVSHELRAPVASMRLMLENLRSGAVPTDDARAEYLRLLEAECCRLSALIANVLDFARIEHDRKVYEMAEADVAAMIGDVIELLQPRATQRRQRLIAELAPIEPAPVVDALALQQAVLNLVDNAMKFSPAGAAITVRTRNRGDGAWEIAVTDEGPGIPAAEQARIFERFYRGGNELRRETQGAGIGLALVKHTVDAHGGRIEVESDHGATFRLIFPCSTSPA